MSNVRESKWYKKRYVPNHPHSMSCGCVYEHRLIMEKQIGRYLEKHEHVHHKDEDRANNDPSNLELCSSPYIHYQQHAFQNEELIQLLIRYADVFGRLPTRRECDAHPEMPHSSTYIRHFEKWSEAIKISQRHMDIMNEEEEFKWSGSLS